MQGKIIKIAGPLVVAKGMEGEKMFNVVLVSEKKLIGEIVRLKKDLAFIQVYEETSGIAPGDPVYLTGESLSVELGPGLLGSIYDGIQRPLDLIAKNFGSYIQRGARVSALDRQKKWEFAPKVKIGQEVKAGDVLGEVQETENFKHRILMPLSVTKGKIKEIKDKGEYSIETEIAKIVDEKGQETAIKMFQSWPVRKPRPFKKKLPVSEVMVTGQRVIDTFFPIVKGGTACVPGPFGAGKTVVQHQLAKWSDAEIIIFVGCGERGNEMTDLLIEFSELKDPKTGQLLLKKSVLVANTSDMPVAAREASIYTGITIAEYFRDMGYNVALLADSTSRWAEALREISGRLEEMPGEEGYPAYLASRTALFYERAGKVECLSSEKREGSVAVIGAVSPPGGDFSEPVTQNTLKVTKVFWELDDLLASRRHFPAINWLDSYSLYKKESDIFFKEKISEDFSELAKEAMSILQDEARLKEIALLIGVEALPEKDKITLQTAKSLREDFLIQNAFDEIDTFTSLKKQYLILKTIIVFHQKMNLSLEEKKEIEEKNLIQEKIAKLKYLPESQLEEIEKFIKEIELK